MSRHSQLRHGRRAEWVKRTNERWYLRRLKLVAEDMKSSVVPRLRVILDALTASQEEVAPGDRAALGMRVREIMGNVQRSFRLPLDAERTARHAAQLNLASTDQWFLRQLASAGWEIPSSVLPQPKRLGDAAPPRLRTGTVRPLATLQLIRGQADVEDAFNDAVLTNIALIRSIPAQYFERLHDDLIDSIASAQHWENLIGRLRDDIAAVNNLADYRVALIARDQTAKMTAAFNEARCAAVGIDRYTWLTARDERVRDEHRELDGQVFAFADPPDEGNPGEAVNCRCVALPLVEEAGEAAVVAPYSGGLWRAA